MTYDIILFTDSAGSFYRIRSLGVYRLATELRNNGYTVKVIDYTVDIFDNFNFTDKLIKKIIGNNTLFVGFSSSHFRIKVVNKNSFSHNNTYLENQGLIPCPYPSNEKRFSIILSAIKKINRDIKVVYGGEWANGVAKLNPKIDYIVQGLADTTIVEIANHLKNGTPLKFMPGPFPGQKIINHDPTGSNFDFPNSFTKFEPTDHIRQGEVVCIETSRGCMFKCKFCNYPLLGRKKTDPKYHKEIDILAQELKYNWDNYKINKYYIIDDTFNETTEKIEAVKTAIIKAGVPDFAFFAYLRLDLLKKHPEQIPLLKSMGLQSAFFGIETLNDISSKLIDKPMKSAEVKKFLTELKSTWGDQVFLHGSFIFGLPYDTPETIIQWMEWLEDLDGPLDSIKIDALNIHKFIPSVFGLDIEKYGYTMTDHENSREFETRVHWKTEQWDYTDAKLLVNKYLEKMYYSRRNKANGWEVMALQDIGYSFADIQSRAKFDYDRLEIRNRLNAHREKYLKELCKYEGIEV
jgi:radical SAM superfamily enzyme YgiQ (UPF0313 family)